ncbi:MAG: hypothetical protein ARM1_0840 [Candidatus Micrarchaeota archaeon]|nr:MAG: hypothetical protein ARM1_0840 [Candidatus Micrarchaeota archaeon]
MLGSELISQEPVSVVEVLEILEKIESRYGLSYEQKLLKDYIKAIDIDFRYSKRLLETAINENINKDIATKLSELGELAFNEAVIKQAAIPIKDLSEKDISKIVSIKSKVEVNE